MIRYFTFLILLASYATLTAQTGKFADHEDFIFEYDQAGNQIFRGIGQITCNTCRASKEPEPTLADIVANKVTAAPVPVEADLQVMWDISVRDYILKIEVLPYNSFTILQSANIANLYENKYIFNMSQYSYGVYYLRFSLSDGTFYTRAILKK